MISGIEQYIPGNPPFDGEGLSRATWDELYRIASTLSAAQTPCAISITSSVSVTVSSGSAYKTLFDNTGTESYNWQQPSGQVGTDGVWECPETALYNLLVVCKVPTTTAPMWDEPVSVATIRFTTNASSETFAYNGVSSLPPLLVLPILRPFQQGDTVEVELDLTRGTESGSATVQSFWLIKKEGIAV